MNYTRFADVFIFVAVMFSGTGHAAPAVGNGTVLGHGSSPAWAATVTPEQLRTAVLICDQPGMDNGCVGRQVRAMQLACKIIAEHEKRHPAAGPMPSYMRSCGPS